MSEYISDQTGKETLEVIREVDRFNRWMFDTILPYSKGRILEIGSGLGNISRLYLESGNPIMLSDLRPDYCSFLEEEFKNYTNLLGVDQINLVHPTFDSKYKNHLEKYDTVFSLNVIEHIEDDLLAVENCKKLLKQNGHLIVLVPSYQKLYNKFDENLGHFRRYTKSTLAAIFSQNGFSIVHKQHFNFTGIFGWYVAGQLMKKETIPGNQMRLYNTLVPFWKLIDKLLIHQIGLSTIVVGKK